VLRALREGWPLFQGEKYGAHFVDPSRAPSERDTLGPGKSKPRMENPPPYAGGRATYPALRHKSSNRCPATRRGSSRRVWIRLNLLGCAPNGLCARPPGRSGRTPRPP
jgi:hypothetical protein